MNHRKFCELSGTKKNCKQVGLAHSRASRKIAGDKVERKWEIETAAVYVPSQLINYVWLTRRTNETEIWFDECLGNSSTLTWVTFLFEFSQSNSFKVGFFSSFSRELWGKALRGISSVFKPLKWSNETSWKINWEIGCVWQSSEGSFSMNLTQEGFGSL